MNSSQRLDTELLRTFLTVARHGNVTRGAEALHRTQSAVSVQIKRLEESLAARLFRREPRGVSLTEAGERLRAAAERIVGDLDETVRTFRADPTGGLVRVGIPEEYGAEVLPAVLADFSARFPAVEVFVRCGFSVEFPEAIRRGELDLAVFADCRRFGQSDTLIRDPMAWVASRPWRFETRSRSPSRSSTAPALGAMSRFRRWKTPTNRTASCSPARAPPESRRRSLPASQSACWREVRSRARCLCSAASTVCRRCPTRSSSCCGAVTARLRSTQWHLQSRVDSIGWADQLSEEHGYHVPRFLTDDLGTGLDAVLDQVLDQVSRAFAHRAGAA